MRVWIRLVRMLLSCRKMPLDPATGTLIAEGVSTGINAITRGGPRRQYKWNKRAARDSMAMQREQSLWLMEQNKKLQAEQREYDSPSAVMARYKAAGLNPHLIYGGGSASGGGAFPFSAQPTSNQVAAPDASFPDVAPSYMEAARTASSIELQRQKTSESIQSEALKNAQTRIAEMNPMLNKDVAAAVVSSMEAVATAKANEARAWWNLRERTSDGLYERYRLGDKKIEAEVEAMSQRLGLNTADLDLKNKVLESKEFENAMLEIQKKFLVDGDLSPDHIFKAVMLILSKMIAPNMFKK